MGKRGVKKGQVVLGVTGSIAAYKAVELMRLLQERGYDVSVVMTRAATAFVGEMTFRVLSRNPVAVDFADRAVEWKPDHIALADRAEVLVLAPCTANVMAKLAHGIADDLLTATALACRAPLVIAPAMNDAMWDHPATQANLEILLSRGARVVSVGSGKLACGREGRGRMAEPAVIAVEIDNILAGRGGGR